MIALAAMLLYTQLARAVREYMPVDIGDLAPTIGTMPFNVHAVVFKHKDATVGTGVGLRGRYFVATQRIIDQNAEAPRRVGRACGKLVDGGNIHAPSRAARSDIVALDSTAVGEQLG